MKRFIVFPVVLALTCCRLFAQDNIARIDSLVTAWYNNHDLSGNILVASHGKVIYKRSLGYANAAERILNNDSSAFQIASVSKAFTAVAILQLKEKGKLKLDDPVNKYLPGEDVIPQKRSLAQVYAIALFEKGPDYAAVRFNQLKDDTVHYIMAKYVLNDIGLHLLYDGHHAEALEALKLNTVLYPGSWNVYDSYGEALALAGKKEEAIAMYQKSIEMNPGNDGGKEALKRLASQ